MAQSMSNFNEVQPSLASHMDNGLQHVHNKLNYFLTHQQLPNLLIHGPNGSGKRTLVNQLLMHIYDNNPAKIRSHVLYVNCSQGKGIRFIREEIKMFAKIHISSQPNRHLFKCIVLNNADKLTIDAQSALRRCIEMYSHNTRFFIITDNKYKLMNPILVRFCELYISIAPGTQQLYAANIAKSMTHVEHHNNQRILDLQSVFLKCMQWMRQCQNTDDIEQTSAYHYICMLQCDWLYERGFCAMDIYNWVKSPTSKVHLEMLINEPQKHSCLFHFQNHKSQFRNEPMLMMFMLHLLSTPLNEHQFDVS
jgi:energy-coupling factor transporter ATP-binding protein EcfA2